MGRLDRTRTRAISPTLMGKRQRGLHRRGPPDRTELQAILEAHPVDLVLHGHTHRPYSGPLLPSEDQRRPWVYEAGSGTFVPSARRPHGHVARYNVYELRERSQGAHVVLHQAFARVYDPTTGLFETKQLPLPAP